MGDGERQGGDVDGTSTPVVSIARLASLGSETGLFGRRDDTAWLDACWAEGAHVASVVAFGGVGKSALVWDWLRGMQRDGWRRAGRAALRVYGWSFFSQGTKDQMTSADAFISAALGWLGDPRPDEGTPWDKGERLALLIKERATLLVLDGVEPLQWGPGPEEGRIKDPALATLVRELGGQNPGLCVITSRLAVRDVGDLAAEKCRRLDLTKLTEEAGAALLRARGVKGAEGDLRAAVREYGGHSLALALLGSFLEDVAGGDVRQRDRIGPLQEDERLGGHARRVMTAYERMLGGGSAEVAILRMLGLFDRPADEGEIAALRAAPVVPGLTEAVAKVGGREWNKAIAKLRRVGLLARAESETDRRLDAHPLVREHFGEQVRREREDAWREGHRRLYEHLKGMAKELPETVEEMAPLYAAVVHGCRAGKSQEALEDIYRDRIQRGDCGFDLRKLGAFGAEVAALSVFFSPPWEKLVEGLTAPGQFLVVTAVAFGLRALGRLCEAVDLTRMALDHCHAQQDLRNAAVQAATFAELLLVRGEFREARAQAERSLPLAEGSGDARLLMTMWAVLADVLHQLGQPEEAMEHLERARSLADEREPAQSLLYPLWEWRYCNLLLDHRREAEVLARTPEALKFTLEHGDLLSIAFDHLSLGRAHLLALQRGPAGSLDEATCHLRQAVEGLRRAGYQEDLPGGLVARAALHTHTRAFALAHKDLDEALSVATRCGLRLHEADTHLGFARLALVEGRPHAALDHLTAARKLITETGYHRRDEELAGLEAEAREMATKLNDRPEPPRTAPPQPGTAPPVSTLAAPVDAPSLPAATKSVMVTPLLDHAEIHTLHAAALATRLTGSRAALMTGIDSRFVDKLPLTANPSEQVLTDLDALNKVRALADRTVPLRIWLRNAEHLAGERVEAAAFTRALGLLPAATAVGGAPNLH